MRKVIVVTGGSSGIGRCAADALAARGCAVYEFSRRAAANSGAARHITADVTDEACVREAVRQVLEAEGRIDVLINNAGFGVSGAAEFTPLEEARQQLEVNFWGMVHGTRAVLPAMRAQGAGRIVNVSSVAGQVPIPFQAFYSASKAAIGSFTMAVANEVRPFGVTVCAVMPGDTNSGFTKARKKCADGDDIYAGRISRSVTKMEQDELKGAGAQMVGEYLARVALGKSKKPLYTIGLLYKLAILLTRLLPASLLNKIIGKLYAS